MTGKEYPWGNTYRQGLYTMLNCTNLKPSNPDKNLNHLSEQNLFDIISNKAAKDTPMYSAGSSLPVQKSNFTGRTRDLLYQIPHKTNLLKFAQSYLGKIVEVTPEEYNKMNWKDKLGTQDTIIGNHGQITDAWCAHTVSYMCRSVGIPIGNHKPSVQEFIDWGKQNGYYRPIKTNTLTQTNYKTEQQRRIQQTKSQIKQMKEGDLVIWKSDVAHTTPNRLQIGQASHIGIIECVNPDGSISVIEGNANEYLSGRYDRYPVTTAAQGKKGNQKIGEAREVNRRDGIIRKIYTPEQLVKNGYSGYINMQKIIK